MHTHSLRALRLVGYLEGTSFLLLLGVAMPLKYFAHSPMAVKVVGAAHGGLWILYLIAAAWAATSRRWGVGKMSGAVAASVLPFGPFVFDARILKPDEEAMKRAAPTPPAPAE